jgi:hypothetical protein
MGVLFIASRHTLRAEQTLAHTALLGLLHYFVANQADEGIGYLIDEALLIESHMFAAGFN